jgi:hypothetical protein
MVVRFAGSADVLVRSQRRSRIYAEEDLRVPSMSFVHHKSIASVRRTSAEAPRSKCVVALSSCGLSQTASLPALNSVLILRMRSRKQSSSGFLTQQTKEKEHRRDCDNRRPKR